jgi:hypothetical protein
MSSFGERVDFRVASGSVWARIASEGVVSGLIGAGSVALWFLILDSLRGKPLYTPTVLGFSLFHGMMGVARAQNLGVSLEIVLFYTWVHTLAFIILGGIAAALVALAEKNSNFGFGLLLLFVLVVSGFLAGALVFARPLLHALEWPEILLGNLLAAGAMALYFRRKHPRVRMRP